MSRRADEKGIIPYSRWIPGQLTAMSAVYPAPTRKSCCGKSGAPRAGAPTAIRMLPQTRSKVRPRRPIVRSSCDCFRPWPIDRWWRVFRR